MDTIRAFFMRRVWAPVLAIGPGIFCIGYTIGTGSVTSMTKAGSMYGMQLLWVVGLSAFFAGVLMEAYGRYAAITGETAIHGFRKRLPGGRFWAVAVVAGVVLGQWSSLSGILALTSNALYETIRLYAPGLPAGNYKFVLGIAAFLITLMYGILLVGRYSLIEKILIFFVGVMFFSFVAVMFIVIPPPGEIARGLVPSAPEGGSLIVAAFVGTTMAAPTFVVRPLVVKKKGWNSETYKSQTRDAIYSASLMFLISAIIMASATGALFHKGLPVDRVMDMVSILEPLAGKFAVAIFMFGAMSAGLSSVFPILMVLPLLVGDYRKGEMDMKSPVFRILTAVACLVGLAVPVMGVNPIQAQILTQVANVFVLPVVVAGGIVLLRDSELMGKHRAGPWFTAAMISAFLFSLAISWSAISGLYDLVCAAK